MQPIPELFDLSHSLAGDWLATLAWPHEALDGIAEQIRRLALGLDPAQYHQPSPEVYIHHSASVASSALIAGPCIIGPGSEIRHCAYIRGAALIGQDCVVGNSSELKNCILFDGVQVPHFNYVGDSILGYKAHMGAGSITSNVKADKSQVLMRIGDTTLKTGRKKVGAFLGDHTEIGCNAVLAPGAIAGRKAMVYPTALLRGTLPENHILKVDGSVVERR